jgi:hypothetical protein
MSSTPHRRTAGAARLGEWNLNDRERMIGIGKNNLARGVSALAAAVILGTALRASGDDGRSERQLPTSEFHFVRLEYADAGGFGSFGSFSGRGHWTVDYPAAEYHFTRGVRRLSNINIDDEARMLSLRDDALFDYPWLYAVEVGHWYLDEEEAARLREYLVRGGFLMVDDFHGPQEWAVFMESMTRVFPDRPVVDIPEDDPILHAVFDLDETVQIPGIRALSMGVTYEYGGKVPHWRGIYDDEGRLMVIINHNMDLGDSWELADAPYYPEHMTTLGYRFAVNYAVYSMTH